MTFTITFAYIAMLYHIHIRKRIYRSIMPRIYDYYRRQIMPKPRCVIIAGWESSGSTFVYQVAKLLGLNVQKIHGKWNHERMDRVIFTIRDPRDVICSHARRLYPEHWGAGEYEKALLMSLDDFLAKRYIDYLFESLRQPNVIIVRYETFFRCCEDALIRMLADQFMIPLDESKVKLILAETSIEANQKRAEKFSDFQEYDKEMYVHGQHITNQGNPGAWKRWFTPVVDNMVKQKIGKELVQLGYEKDTNWSSKS